MKRIRYPRCLAAVVVCAVCISAMGAAKFPEAGWRGLSAKTLNERRVVIVDHAGREVASVRGAHHSKIDGTKILVSDEGLVIDGTEAKAPKPLVFEIPVPRGDYEPLLNRTMFQSALWRGPDRAEVNALYEGESGAKRRHWFVQSEFRLCTVRRSHYASAVLDAELNRLSLRYDILHPDRGRYVFSGVTFGSEDEVAPKPPQRIAFDPQPLYVAAKPVVPSEARLGTGEGEIDPSFLEAGTIALRLKAPKGAHRGSSHLIAFPRSGDVTGLGHIWFWIYAGGLRFDASDHARNWRVKTMPDDGLAHTLAVSWDAYGYTVAIDGELMFNSSNNSDGFGPMSGALHWKTALGFYTYNREPADRMMIGKGPNTIAGDYRGEITDLKVWKGRAELAELEKMTVATKKQKVDYRKEFGDEEPNVYEKPDGELDLELVETIKFDAAGFAALKAANRIRTIGKTRIGKLGNTEYLECGLKQNDRFAVRFMVDPKHPLYVIDFDYPDDRKRTADLIVQDATLRKTDGQTGADYTLQVGVFCGDEYPSSNKIETHRCLYWTSVSNVALVAMTARPDVPAALSEVRVYRVRDAKLPSLAIDEPPADDTGWRRSFALYYEDPAIGYDFGTRRSSGYDLDELSTMIDRTAAYMKYCGQNLFCYPGVWYQGRIGENGYNPRGHADDFLTAWYLKFEKEGLGVIPNVNPNNMLVPDGLVTRETMTNGALHDSPIAIHDTGKPNWGGWHNSPPNFCFGHPDVQREIERHIDNLLEQGVPYRSFRGLCMHMTMHCMLWWGDIRSGYNDYVVEAFANDLGIEKLRGREIEKLRDDPLRGREYAKIINGDPELYAKWVQWRCDHVTRFYARMAEKLRTRRPDLKLWLNSFIQPDFLQPDFMTEGFMERQAREAGLDKRALAAIPNLIICQTALPAFVRKRDRNLFKDDASYLYNRELQSHKGYFALLDGASYPWIQQFDLYWENPSGRDRNSLSCEWLRECTWRVTTINAGGIHALRSFVEPLRHRDVLGYSKGGYLIGTYGMEGPLRRFMKAFRSLPAVVMDDVDGDAFVKVRACTFKGKRYGYVVNTEGRERTFRDWKIEPYELRVVETW